MTYMTYLHVMNVTVMIEREYTYMYSCTCNLPVIHVFKSFSLEKKIYIFKKINTCTYSTCSVYNTTLVHYLVPVATAICMYDS